MKGTYRVLALLVPILVAFQAFVIGLEIFGLGSWVEDGNSFTKPVLEGDEGSVTGGIGGDLHGIGAELLALVGLLLLIVSFFAKIQGGVKWALFVFLDIVLQWALAFGAFLAAWQIGAFHPLNAFVLAGLGIAAYRNAKKSAVAAEVPASAAV